MQALAKLGDAHGSMWSVSQSGFANNDGETPLILYQATSSNVVKILLAVRTEGIDGIGC